MRLQEPWNSTKSVWVLKDHSPPLNLQVYPRPPALISCVPMHSPVLCSQIMKELIMSCWHNDGVSKENLHFDDHSTGKLIVFFKLHCFLKEIENMFSVFLSSYRNTHESLGELEKAVETLTGSLCSHSISCSPKFSLVLLQLDRNMVHVFYFLNKTVCARDDYMSQCYLIWIFINPFY